MFFLLAFSNILSAQLLTVNNLQHLTTGSINHLDAKLTEHFGLERYEEMEDANNRVYSNDDPYTNNFKVLTVFIDAKNCFALSVVTHDQAEVKNFHHDLLKEGFEIRNHKDREGKPVKVYSKQNFIVSIKEPDNKTPVHQIVWRCQ